jgi:hypothetical protein
VRHKAPDPAPSAGRGGGSIRADELLPFSEAARRLGWCAKSRRFAQRDGLRVIRYGRFQYVLGTDLLDFFRRLAEGQAGQGGGNDGT